MAADGGRAPAGGRSPEGGSRGGTPAGPCRSFPSPQGQVPSAPRLGGAWESLSASSNAGGPQGRGAGRRFKDSGGSVRPAVGGGGGGGDDGGGCRAAARRHRGVRERLPPSPCGGDRGGRPRSSSSSWLRRARARARAAVPGRGALPPPLCGPVSAEGPCSRGRPRGRPAGFEAGDGGGGGRVPSALPRLRGRAAARARCALLGRCRRLSCAAPRLALPRLSPRRPSLSSDAPVAPAAGRCRWGTACPAQVLSARRSLRRRRPGECGWPRAERRRRRSVSVPLGDGRPEGARCRRRRSRPGPCPSLPRRPSRPRVGRRGCGRPRGRFPARSPRGNEESGRCSPGSAPYVFCRARVPAEGAPAVRSGGGGSREGGGGGGGSRRPAGLGRSRCRLGSRRRPPPEPAAELGSPGALPSRRERSRGGRAPAERCRRVRLGRCGSLGRSRLRGDAAALRESAGAVKGSRA